MLNFDQYLIKIYLSVPTAMNNLYVLASIYNYRPLHSMPLTLALWALFNIKVKVIELSRERLKFKKIVFHNVFLIKVIGFFS